MSDIPYGIDSVYQILETMIYPDIIEDVSQGDVLDQRNTFAVVKSTENSVMVVLSVGGKRNPNVTPQQIIIFSRQRWQTLMKQSLTIREILYSNSGKRRGTDPEIVKRLKKIELPWRTVNHNIPLPRRPKRIHVLLYL